MHHPSLSRRLKSGIAIAAVIALSSSGQAVAATTDPDPGALEIANGTLSLKAATQGMVLLENIDSALPMATTGNVAVFGVGAYKTVKGGTGSGDVNNRSMVTVRQALEDAHYTVTTSDAYWDAMTSAYDTKYGSSGGSLFGPAIDYSSVEQQLTDTTVQPTAATDTALFVVARNAGEGADRSSGAGDYLLTDTEKSDIALIGETYKRVVVLLNTGGIMDTSFFRTINADATDPDGGPALDSLLLMSQAGQATGTAVVQVLNGAVDPSGKLTDTWASKYSYYPASETFAKNDGDSSTEDYSEGIYVGYRYFDSFYKSIDSDDPASVVDYPFGYGLSYTSFTLATQSVKATGSKVTVKVKVTNTGTTSGRQVVQVYFSAPQTGVDKPYQELGGYGKTDVLKAGRSQVLTIAFRTSDMSSYNEVKSAYVLDAGSYLIRVGDSSRSTRVAARIRLARSRVTEKVNHETADQKPDSVLTSDPSDFYTYATEATEIAQARTITLNPASIRTVDSESEYEQDVTVGSSSPYYAIDGKRISSTTAYVSTSEKTDWQGTGAAYAPKKGETVKYVRTKAGATLYDVKKGKLSMTQFVAGLTVEQLANIVEGTSSAGSTLGAAGAAGYTTAKYESSGIPAMVLSDGPAGLRITQKLDTDPVTYQWATAWPIGTLLAQTWDRDLLTKVYKAIGKEMVTYGATLWLAPGMNIHRDPLNGRNFEYYSEDPLVAGLTAAAATKGVQSNPGVGVTLKHYAANNQETDRNSTNSVMDERTAREIYLKGFEIAVTSAQPMAIMTSYNKINGTWSSANYDLNTDLLRGEWGFKGLVMTDWGGTHGAVQTMYSGNDLIEPGGAPTDVTSTVWKVAPTMDASGLPAYTKQSFTFGGNTYTFYTWKLGGLTLAADGAESITTTVDASSDLGTYDDVNAAYTAVQDILASASALTSAQKAAISVTDVVHSGDDSSPVTSYTVTLKGNYPASYDMRLGDLQRSVTRILTIAMQSAPFAELAKDQKVKGITVKSYTAQFRHLAEIVTVTKK